MDRRSTPGRPVAACSLTSAAHPCLLRGAWSPPRGMSMHAYRTHTCNALTAAEVGREARLSGWIHRKRDHGNLLFIDLRDHYGITQCVADSSSEVFGRLEALRSESVITVTGEVVLRSSDTINPKLPTGEIELRVRELMVQSEADLLPL